MACVGEAEERNTPRQACRAISPNRGPRRARLSAVLLTAGALGVSACGTDEQAPQQITMQGLQFSPREATAAVGQRIEWRNAEEAPHNVIATTGADFRSQTITRDGTFTATAGRSGIIEYHCSLHPGMTGTLRVR
jgi:plastocyanin